MAVLSGPVKRRPTIAILRVGIDLARSKKALHHGIMAIQSGKVKRRVA
jgi:hypothetical protein